MLGKILSMAVWKGVWWDNWKYFTSQSRDEHLKALICVLQTLTSKIFPELAFPLICLVHPTSILMPQVHFIASESTYPSMNSSSTILLSLLFTASCLCFTFCMKFWYKVQMLLAFITYFSSFSTLRQFLIQVPCSFPGK